MKFHNGDRVICTGLHKNPDAGWIVGPHPLTVFEWVVLLENWGFAIFWEGNITKAPIEGSRNSKSQE